MDDKDRSLQEQDDWFPQIIPAGDHGEIIMNSDGSILIKGGDFKHTDEQRRRSFDKSEYFFLVMNPNNIIYLLKIHYSFCTFASTVTKEDIEAPEICINLIDAFNMLNK